MVIVEIQKPSNITLGKWFSEYAYGSTLLVAIPLYLSNPTR